MKRLVWRTPTMRVGVALSADRVTAILPGAAAAAEWTHPLTPSSSSSTLSLDLEGALRSLRAAVVAHDDSAKAFAGVLHVALLPPLADLRRVELPGLTVADARRVLRREPSRYLPVPPDGPPVEVEVEADGWRRTSPFTVVAVPRTVVDGICDAARASGWSVAEIVPAHAAWAAGAGALSPGAENVERVLVVRLEDRTDVLHVRGGRVASLRRVPIGAEDAVSRAMGVRDDASRHAATAARSGPSVVSLTGHAAAAAAARFAPRAAGPALLAETERAALDRRTRRAVLVRFAAAASLLVAAAGTELVATSRERASLAAQRARLADRVTRAMATRDSLIQISDRLAALHSAAATAPRWSAIVAALGTQLPEDAYLVSLRGDGDTLRLEGSSARAAPVFDAVGRIAGVESVRPEGPIRQEVKGGGGPPTERFTLSALLGGQP